MKGLLYKDLYLIRKNIIGGMGFLLATFVWNIIIVLGMTRGNLQAMKEESDIFELFFKGFIFLMIFTGVYVSLTSASAIDMDEKSEWFKVLYASPVTIWQEIMSRYLLAFIVNTLMTIWSACLLPFLYFAGEKSFGASEMKNIAYCWIFGMIAILLRLPLDIIFPAKVSMGIMIGFIAVVMTGFMVWLFDVEEVEIIFGTIAGWVDFIYKNRLIVMLCIIVISFVASYIGKKNRRWA